MTSPPWTARTVKKRRAWHDITALGQHTWSNDVGRGMTSLPWTARTIEKLRAWHDITALGQLTRSSTLGMDDITAFGQHT